MASSRALFWPQANQFARFAGRVTGGIQRHADDAVAARTITVIADYQAPVLAWQHAATIEDHAQWRRMRR